MAYRPVDFVCRWNSIFCTFHFRIETAYQQSQINELTVKISLIVLWALSIIGLSVLGIKQATEQAFDGNFIIEKSLAISTADTLHLMMRSDNQYGYDMRQDSGLEIKYTKQKKRIIYSRDIEVTIKSSKDSVGKIIIEKKAEGNNSLEAHDRAEAIEYNYRNGK